MQPVVAGSGAEALDLFRENHRTAAPFSLLLTDANMPEMNGFELVEHIRSDADLRNVTIMMLTSAGQHGDAVLEAAGEGAILAGQAEPHCECSMAVSGDGMA